MALITFVCPACGAKLRAAAASVAGKKITCPKCSSKSTLPAADEPPLAESVTSRAPRFSARSKVPHHEVEGESEGLEAPRRPRRAKKRGNVVPVLAVVAVLAVFVAGAAFVAYKILNRTVNVGRGDE